MVVQIHVTILVADGFVPTELALVQDSLRIVNRLGQNQCFITQICSADDAELVEGLGGILLRTTPFRVDDSRLPDHLIVLGGTGIRHSFNLLRARLRWIERMDRHILLMSDAASEWQRLHSETDHMTTHWEIQQLDRDAEYAPDHDLPLYARTSRITTAAGMMAAADVVLDRIVAPLSRRLAQSVGQVLLMDRIRDGDASQPRSENHVAALRLVNLETVIAAMEQHLETPLRMSALAALAGVSVRQLERKFRSTLGQSPVAFYRTLRLRRARNLVEQTSLHITEISAAFGFGSSSNFAKMYAREFGISPTQRRLQLSDAAPKHPLTLQSLGTHHASFPLSPRPTCASSHAAGADETAIRSTGR